MAKIPWEMVSDVDAVDQDYLTNLLAQAGYSGADVVKFEREIITDKQYGGGMVVRFRLLYGPDTAESNPKSLILKVCKPNSAQRNDSGHISREAHCYEYGLLDNLSPGLYIPKHFSTVVHLESGTYWLWMEDLGVEAFQIAWTAETVQKVVRDIAGMHAVWWERRVELEAFTFLRYRAQAMYQRQYIQCFERLCTAIDSHPRAAVINKVLTRPRRDLLRGLQDIEDQVYEKLDALPQTLLHQDVWPPNIGFHQGKTALIDWSYAGIGTPGVELCPLAFNGVFWIRDVVDKDEELLLEPLWRTLHHEYGLPIDYEDIRSGYLLALTLRPASQLIFPVLQGIITGRSPVPKDVTDYSNTEAWLDLFNIGLQKIEHAAQQTGIF